MEQRNRASKKKVNLADRRQRALDLRRQGWSYRKIADFMEVELGSPYSESMAYRDVTAALDLVRTKLKETAEDVLQLELDRLDTMTVVWWPKAVGLGQTSQPGLTVEEQVAKLMPDVKAAELVLDIMARRAKYLGLDKPGELNLRTPEPLNMKHGPDLTGADEETLDRIINNLQAAVSSSIDRKTSPPTGDEQ